jgi:cyclohexanone monooxygenase
MEKFKGHAFHTSRWDYKYTGGSHSTPMDKLADKRVAVIGTGATGIQCIPRVAASAAHTYVVQRTPSTVGPRGNAPTDPEWAETLKPGWQKELIRDFEGVLQGHLPKSAVLGNEGLLKLLGTVADLRGKLDPEDVTPENMVDVAQAADYLTLERLRARVDDVVKDPDMAEALKPWYNLMCKRPTFNDEYLHAFNRDNVSLVDVSATQGIEEMTETGFIAHGEHHEVDCIVYASGFEITSDFERRINIPIYGRGGELIYDHWSEGMRTMHGMMLNGFPNFYMVGGLFAFTLGLNYSSAIGDQVDYVLHIVEALKSKGLTTAEPTREAEDEWISEQTAIPQDAVIQRLGGASTDCTPGYYNQEGRALDARRDPRRDGYTPGGLAYIDKLEKWRTNNDQDGLLLR